MSPYRLAEQSFPTKKAVTDYVRAVRDKTTIGQAITDPVVLRLLSQHPQWTEKSEGMDRVTTGLLQGHPSAPARKEILLLRSDGRVVDISWSKLIPRLQKDGQLCHLAPAIEHLNELRIAARFEVEDQLKAKRKKGYELDHSHPKTFERILHDWVVMTGLCLHDIGIESSHGSTVSRWFVNRGLASSWCAYHQNNAELVLRTKKEHNAQPQLRIDWSAVLSSYQA